MSIALEPDKEARIRLGEKRYCNGCGSQVKLQWEWDWALEYCDLRIAPPDRRDTPDEVSAVLDCSACSALRHWHQTRPTPELPEGYEDIRDMDK